MVDVELDFEDRHCRLELVEVARGTVHGFWDEFEDEVQIDLIFLKTKSVLPMQLKGAYARAPRWSSRRP